VLENSFADVAVSMLARQSRSDNHRPPESDEVPTERT
jgi:hypothetical protein